MPNELSVRRGNPASLKPHPKNVRIHDETNIASIMRSLSQFGQRTPIVVNKKRQVLKGNGTLEAVLRLEWPTIEYVVADLPAAQELAYMIADNKTSDLSEFDYGGLTEILRELRDLEVDLEDTGFTEHEYKPLFEAQDWRPREREESEAPEVLRVQFNEEQSTIVTQAYAYACLEDIPLSEFLTGLCRSARAERAVKKRRV